MSRVSETHDATASRFLDERGTSVALAPNGLNPANILEKAVRDRIVNSLFFQDVCFGLNEADIVSRVATHVTFIGGTYGVTQTPSPFICLAFKLLQLSPTDDVLREYLDFGGEKFKYLRALALFYVRLTRQGKECYEILEPYLEDRRKLRRTTRQGRRLTYVDEFVDELLTRERVCGTSLFKIPRRRDLEDLEVLEPRVSKLGDIEDLLDETSGDEQGENDGNIHGDEDNDKDDEPNGENRVDYSDTDRSTQRSLRDRNPSFESDISRRSKESEDVDMRDDAARSEDTGRNHNKRRMCGSLDDGNDDGSDQSKLGDVSSSK